MKIKNCILMAVMACFALEAGAQSALPFIRIDRNPRSSALAGAGMASVNNGWYAAFGSAAQLGFQPVKGDVGAALQLWEMSNDVDKTTNIQAGAGLRFGSFGVALGGAYQMGVMQGTYTPSDRLVSLGLAYNMKEIVSIGLNARYAAQSFTQEAKVSGFSMDISALGRITPELTVALGVGCLGSQVKGSADAYPQPAYARAGVAWNHAIGQVHALRTESKELAQIAVETLNSLNKLSRSRDRLLEIVEDGEVQADEYADFAEIKSTLDRIALSVSNLQLWVDEQIAAGNLVKPKA